MQQEKSFIEDAAFVFVPFSIVATTGVMTANQAFYASVATLIMLYSGDLYSITKTHAAHSSFFQCYRRRVFANYTRVLFLACVRELYLRSLLLEVAIVGGTFLCARCVHTFDLDLMATMFVRTPVNTVAIPAAQPEASELQSQTRTIAQLMQIVPSLERIVMNRSRASQPLRLPETIVGKKSGMCLICSEKKKTNEITTCCRAHVHARCMLIWLNRRPDGSRSCPNRCG